MDSTKAIGEQVANLYLIESRRVLATLIRLLGDFDLAEESLQEAFQAALEQWPREGIPRNPRAWLVSAGRFKGIDALRRRGRGDALLGAVAEASMEPTAGPEGWDDETIQDDQLRLIFTCRHPLLPQDARIALALSEVCGLTTAKVRGSNARAPGSGFRAERFRSRTAHSSRERRSFPDSPSSRRTPRRKHSSTG